MRVAGLVVGLQAAVVHDLVNIVVELVLRHKVVLAHGLADDLADGQTRGQAGERSWKMICILVRSSRISAGVMS